MASGSNYEATDGPSTTQSGGYYRFWVKIIDVCNGENVVEEQEFQVDW